MPTPPPPHPPTPVILAPQSLPSVVPSCVVGDPVSTCDRGCWGQSASCLRGRHSTSQLGLSGSNSSKLELKHLRAALPFRFYFIFIGAHPAVLKRSFDVRDQTWVPANDVSRVPALLFLYPGFTHLVAKDGVTSVVVPGIIVPVPGAGLMDPHPQSGHSLTHISALEPSFQTLQKGL